jgi:hypothetical protein
MVQAAGRTDTFVILFGIKNHCHGSERSHSLYLLLSTVVTLTAVIIKVCHSYQQHTKLSLNIFLSQLLLMQMKLSPL